MNLSSEDVQDILRLLDTLPYGEFVLETSQFTLRLRRAEGGIWAQELTVLTDPGLTDPGLTDPGPAEPRAGRPPAVADSPAAAHVPAVPPAAEGPPAADGLRDVRAPLLGTFYRAPNPGAPPFVEVGATVTADTVVAIIETMKLMNPVYAGLAGTVAEICLADGEFAARDAVLMRVSAGAG